MKELIINKLHDYLLDVESVPLKDEGNVVTTTGGDAKIMAIAVKECIRIAERAFNGCSND